MKSANLSIVLSALILLTACGKNDSSTTTPPDPPAIPLPNGLVLASPTPGINVIPLSVNGTQCGSGANSYVNKPCISVTVCDPAGNNCQVINDLLVDTGSYGLRVFSSVLSAPLKAAMTPVTMSSLPVAECVRYGDGSKQWGPVRKANVQLGSEPPVSVSMQIIDSSFTGMSAKCAGAMTSVAAGGFNGIIGVGLFNEDCGTGCTPSSAANNGLYFKCDTVAGTCTGTNLSLANQVSNPVGALTNGDQNGLILALPDIASAGTSSVEGYLVLGIDSRDNNIPDPAIRTFQADTAFGEFTTTFQGYDEASFIDSGSNSFAFPYTGSVLTDCSGWFCPSSPQQFSAVTTGVGNSASGTIAFEIRNFLTFYYAGYDVSKTIGGSTGTNLSGMFDWGLPFYVGRNVYHGIEGRTSASLGTGPYWAY